MTVRFNHTIVNARDNERSAQFLAEILGLPTPHRWGPFVEVTTADEVALAFINAGGDVGPQHYAFLVSEDDFDAIFARIAERNLAHWADPHKQQPGEINHEDGGRGVYFDDPDGHLLEIITRPYGSGTA
jgi:catechol 2,3-dioxygenase-like lactoylglutathione lyase family enzyme